MSKMSAVEAREHFSEVINRAAYAKERVVLTRRGKELVAVVPIEDVEVLQELEDRIDIEQARAVLKETKKKGTVPWEKLKVELGL